MSTRKKSASKAKSALAPPSELQQITAAVALHQNGKLAEAEAIYRKVLTIQPLQADALHLLGLIEKQKGNFAEAIALIEKAIAQNPNAAALHANLGNTYRESGWVDRAIRCYEQALKLQPDFADCLNNYGNALKDAGDYEQAVAKYLSALKLQPNHTDAHNNLGGAYHKLGRLTEAATHYRRALELNPSYAMAHYNLGNALVEAGELEQGIAHFRESVRCDPTYVEAYNTLLRQLQTICDWREYDTLCAALHKFGTDGTTRNSGKVFPFAFLAIPASSADQQQCARLWVQQQYRPYLEYQTQHPFVYAKNAHAKIRIGYLSSDFHNHATAYLMAEVFELHDRERFETYAFSLGPDDNKDMRPRLVRAFDHFIDLRGQTFQQCAQHIHAQEIDILIDLKGYTKDTGTPIMAFRPAPVQVSHLGYPGTLGAEFIDYIITDNFVTPPEAAPYYDEKCACMPDCYQPNDRQRKIAERPTRAECGLPEQGVVFCCFNHTYKITPTLFALWCRLLQAVPGSVLWLLKSNHLAQDNLRREAAMHGVSADRILFAAELPLERHLARLQLADLFLDTQPYNAHTTASDALWTGVPVVTCAGDTFASRVAGSLLHAVGLPELITRTLADYEALALRLALHPDELAVFKRRLLDGRMSAPLFDSAKFTRNMEALFETMWKRHVTGKPSAAIDANSSNASPAFTSTALPMNTAEPACPPPLQGEGWGGDGLNSANAQSGINIVHIWHDQHKPIFERLITQIEAALKDNGVQCTRTENTLADHTVNLLVGSTIFVTDKLREESRGRRYIVYQMEQLCDRSGNFRARPNYLALLKEADWVWDYSGANVEVLKKQGVNHISHVPVGYHPTLEYFTQSAEKDIDVLFYGSLTQRRKSVMLALHEKGVKVRASFGEYGKTLDELIARSRIVLNAHQFDNVDTLEEVRLSYLLSNRCFVVSEDADHNPYGDGLVFCPYEQLTETCMQYLKAGEDARQAIAERGYQAIRHLDYTRLTQAALQDMAATVPVARTAKNTSALRFNIVLVSINDHKAIFEDVVIALQAAFNDLHIPCTRTENIFINDAINLLIGSVNFAGVELLESLKGKSYLLYQMEQLATDRGHLPKYPLYTEVMKNALCVWDYSQTNIARLAQMGIANAIHVPAGYHKALEVIAHDQPKDIDVLFYGTLSPRREHIIQSLAARGVAVKVAFGIYGEARNALIARARIILNIHCDEINTLEEVRLSYLLSNRCFVVSEQADHNPYGDGVAFCPYAQLVDTCVHYLQAGDAARQGIADKGYQAIRRLDYTASINTALQKMADILPLPQPEPPAMQQATAPASPVYYSYARPEVIGLIPASARTVLDIGCGAGMLGKALKERQPCHVTGIELMPEIAAQAAAALDQVLSGDVMLALPTLPDNHFDAIIMADVLERTADSDTMLQLALRKLKPEGKLVLSLPNVRHWSVLKNLLEGNWEYQAQGILDRTHLRFFTRNSAIATLTRNGFKVEQVAATKLKGGELPPAGLGAVLKTFGIEALDIEEGAMHFQYLFVCGK